MTTGFRGQPTVHLGDPPYQIHKDISSFLTKRRAQNPRTLSIKYWLLFNVFDTRMSMELSIQLLSKLGNLLTYLGDLQPTYIGVRIYLLSTMDIPAGILISCSNYYNPHITGALEIVKLGDVFFPKKKSHEFPVVMEPHFPHQKR